MDLHHTHAENGWCGTQLHCEQQACSDISYIKPNSKHYLLNLCTAMYMNRVKNLRTKSYYASNYFTNHLETMIERNIKTVTMTYIIVCYYFNFYFLCQSRVNSVILSS